MFHEIIVSQADPVPHRTNTEIAYDNSYMRRGLLCLRPRSDGTGRGRSDAGFEFSIASLRGKWKLSQDHPTANRPGVVKGLRDAAGAESREVAEMLSSLENERQDEPHD
jgi:hypothetical protein